jgi:hypothetical protein
VYFENARGHSFARHQEQGSVLRSLADEKGYLLPAVNRQAKKIGRQWRGFVIACAGHLDDDTQDISAGT